MLLIPQQITITTMQIFFSPLIVCLLKPSIFYNSPVVGLDVSVDRILEIACIVTDGNLTKSVEVSFIIYHFGSFQSPIALSSVQLFYLMFHFQKPSFVL